mgnify:CR=1 FL=1
MPHLNTTSETAPTMPRRPLPTPQDEGDRQLLFNVQTHGWHVVMVPADEETPGWCFTVGLQHNFQHPEIVVFGLPLDTAHVLLNTAGAAIQAGREFAADVRYDDFHDGYECAFQPVRSKWHEPFLGYACWFYGEQGFRALQLSWPDRDGALPWDTPADSQLRASQPLLFESEEGAAGVLELLASMEET